MTSEFFYDSGFDNCFQDAPIGQSFVTDQFVLLDYQLNRKHIDMAGVELIARCIKSWSKKWGVWLSDYEEALITSLIGPPLNNKEVDGLFPRKENDYE